jgi:hypothetical protein
MLYFLLYLWSLIPKITGIFVILSIVIVLLGVMWLVSEGEVCVDFKAPIVKLYLILTAIFAFLTFTLPSQKDALVIYLVPQIIQSEGIKDVTQVLNKLPAVLRKEIEQYLEEKK